MKKTVILFLLMCGGTAYAQTVLRPLPYAADALEPVMSRETLEYHHGKHVQTYVDNINRLVPGTLFAGRSMEYISKYADGAIFNNGAQIYNHQLFFDGFAPESIARQIPAGPLLAAIICDFGTFENFRKEFTASASNLFGSGWTWLSVDPSGKLHIASYPNAGNPLKEGNTPLVGFDIWEHSYYIDYRNKKADYLKNLWRIVDWKVVESRYENR